ncbi:AAA family ATPase [[Ruminococcus] lactaris]|uniref:AAA family ATPase n=1 Tax=[Ruminococcus] lactaris TaxID=46228 RepID=UPI00351FBBA1
MNFIDSDRLFSSNKQARTREIVRGDKVTRDEMIRMRRDGRTEEYSEQINKSENIIRAAREILFRIQRARQIYSLESEKKDRNFPDRLVQYVDSQSEFFDDEQINEQLDDLEKKRLELEKAGLVLPGKKTLAPTASIDDTMRKFYTLYIKDTFEKLSVYDTIKAKLELFIEIINTKTVFSNKQMRIDNEKGVVFEPLESKSGKKHVIPLEKLSSGEKHDFIMFYELIFNADRTSVFLIDEPEISLHVAWQMEFIDILERICKLNGTQAIIATHSPDIVNGHDDLLISLGVN